jgi:D-glycero-D-manno-heptose 1,7-bisphosphate phosphatase
MTMENFEKIRKKMKRGLQSAGAHVDAEYYCFHHPLAKKRAFRVDCECRKPKPGLLVRASRELGLDLGGSFMIGDSLIDVQAGKEAGCTTLLLGMAKCDYCKLMEERNVHPDYIVPSLLAAVRVVEEKLR